MCPDSDADADAAFAPSADQLAGVVDLFGALTRDELAAALAELAYKRGDDHDPSAFETDIEAAVHSYHVVCVDEGAETDNDSLLVVGPVAFPELPDGGTDLPHIVDVPDRRVDPATAAEAAEARFRRDAAVAVETGDADRVTELLDVSYELEAWGPVDLSEARTRLDRAQTN
jgi:hypothetical protein